MLVGYARVSTGDQKLDLQLDALKQAGCERIFTDQISGSKTERPGLQEALSYVRAGDTLVVWRPGAASAAVSRIWSQESRPSRRSRSDFARFRS